MIMVHIRLITYRIIIILSMGFISLEDENILFKLIFLFLFEI